MPGSIRSHLTYANVMATIAVFVALGGTSYAALTITGKNIKNNTVAGRDIKNNTITGSDIKTGAVNEDDVKDGSLSVRDFKPSDLYRGPAGETGPRGPVGLLGPFGPTGPLGPTGLTGAQGDTGAQGLKGDTGAQGLPGAKGDKGETGAQGLPGAKGDKGETGAQGLPGAKGDKGETGAQGLPGAKGDKGETGAQGLPGAKGDKGDPGPAGPGAVLRDGIGVTLGRVLSSDRDSATVLTSTGYHVTIPYTGVFRPAQIYYTGANCGGTAYLNDGGIGVGPGGEDSFITDKWVVYSGSHNTLMRPSNGVGGTSDNVEFTAATIDNPDCGGSAGQRSGWPLTPISRATAGLPATIAKPVTIVSTG